MSVVAQHDFRQPGYDHMGPLPQAVPALSDVKNKDDLEKALRLSGMLQTTLEVDKIIDIFAAEVAKFVDYQYLNYVHEELNISQSFGQPAPHSCTYRLIVSGDTLGEMVISRNKKFSKLETTLLETLLCGLVYPLRNGLLYQKAIDAAHRDPLTGVHNRASMDSAIDREITLARRHGNQLSLLAMDIDHFKKVNDTYGHAMGDCVIKAVAETSKATIRSTDIIYRYGGEEFLILLSNTDKEGATQLAERLRQQIEETCIICDGIQISTTVSIGVTHLENDETREQLFAHADSALYEAKASGRNCCKLYKK